MSHAPLLQIARNLCAQVLPDPFCFAGKLLLLHLLILGCFQTIPAKGGNAGKGAHKKLVGPLSDPRFCGLVHGIPYALLGRYLVW
jgi:hypothetical protein